MHVKNQVEVAHFTASEAHLFLANVGGLTVVRRDDGMAFERTTSDRWFTPGIERVHTVEQVGHMGITALHDPRNHD